MSLTTKFKQKLKAEAHKLKPVVLVGNQGLTEGVKKEVDRALHDHELIKVRIAAEDRELRRALFAELSADVNAVLVQTIGNIGVFYRKREE